MFSKQNLYFLRFCAFFSVNTSKSSLVKKKKKFLVYICVYKHEKFEANFTPCYSIPSLWTRKPSTLSGKLHVSSLPKARQWRTALTKQKWSTFNLFCKWRTWRPLLVKQLPTLKRWKWMRSVLFLHDTPRNTRPNRFVILYFADSYLFFFKYYYLICLWFLHQADRAYPRGTPKHSTAVSGGGQDALHPSMAITPRVWYQILHCQVRWKDRYNRRSMSFMNDNPRGFPFAYFSIIQIQRE